MSHRENEDFQLYLSRIRPIYHQLFNIAHAITGSCELAEYSLQYAMMDYWSANAGNRHGFREGLRNTLIHAAMRSSSDQADFTWNGLVSESGDMMAQLIAQESLELRRVLALKYGCGLSAARIGRIMGMEAKRIQAALNRFEARSKRKLDAGQRRRCDGLILQAVRADFNQPCAISPEMNSAFRSFEADAAAASRSSRLPGRILSWVFALILALICVVGFWFAAVLIQPPVLDAPAEIAIEETE